MLKALFIAGQCVRLLHTDPWQVSTYHINTVGEYSYRVSEIWPNGLINPRPQTQSLSFKDQRKYKVSTCPRHEF